MYSPALRFSVSSGVPLMPKFSRRRFALGAAAAAATATIHPGELLSQQTPAKPPAPLEQEARDAMAKLTPAARAEVEMKVSDLFRKYGDKLTDEQKVDIRKVMAETQEGLEKMRLFVVANGDQPATVLRPYRGGKKA